MKTFEEMLAMLSQECMAKVMAFHARYAKEFSVMPASLRRHHSWPGGYSEHVLEVMNNALIIDANVPLPRKNYTKDDLILASYFHDIDKLNCRYIADAEKPTSRQVDFARSLGIVLAPTESKRSISRKIELKQAGQPIDPAKISMFVYNNGIPSYFAPAMVCRICYENGIKLSDQALHAITFHEGGFTPGMEPHTELQPLAAVIHAADLLSTIGQNGAK